MNTQRNTSSPASLCTPLDTIAMMRIPASRRATGATSLATTSPPVNTRSRRPEHHLVTQTEGRLSAGEAAFVVRTHEFRIDRPSRTFHQPRRTSMNAPTETSTDRPKTGLADTKSGARVVLLVEGRKA